MAAVKGRPVEDQLQHIIKYMRLYLDENTKHGRKKRDESRYAWFCLVHALQLKSSGPFDVISLKHEFGPFAVEWVPSTFLYAHRRK